METKNIEVGTPFIGFPELNFIMSQPQADEDLYDITLGLLAKAFDESIEDVFSRIVVKRYTVFYHLPKSRTLVAILLKELNPK